MKFLQKLNLLQPGWEILQKIFEKNVATAGGEFNVICLYDVMIYGSLRSNKVRR